MAWSHDWQLRALPVEHLLSGHGFAGPCTLGVGLTTRGVGP
jgi:hypothetical protein